MTSPADLNLVVGIVALNGGEIVGKTRLQKTVYLLDVCGLGSGMEFDYYNFGPYESDVAFATDLAVLTGRLTAETRPGFHSVPYSVFRTSEPVPSKIGLLPAVAARSKLDVLKSYSALDLEIAAALIY